jgi:aspartate beta-hydroxylase
MEPRLDDSLSDRDKRDLVWRLIRDRSLDSGYGPGALDRVEAYLSTVYGLEEPAWGSPFQTPAHTFSGLTAKAFHDPAEYQGVAKLEQAFGAIKDEFLTAHSLPRFGPHPQKLVDTGKWDAFHFYTYGRRIDQNHAACPKTSKVIDSIDGTDSAGIVYFSVLHDGTHVRAHNGVTNTRVRCQLCLAAAEKGCEIRVDSETRSWVPGKCMIFDDSFEHEAWNHSGAERVVLIVDLWHPELTPCERQAVAMINAMFDSYEKFRRQVQDRLREAEAFPA